MSPLAAIPAAAHEPTNCYHGHQTEGDWHAHYLGHRDEPNGNHYNTYKHFLNGNFQHYRDVLCN